MPELPDVQVFKEYFDATALHRKVEVVERCDSKMTRGTSPEKIEEALTGRAFEGTRRYGKWLFADTGGGPWLVLHFGMTGYLRTYKDEEQAPGHIRLLVKFDNGYRLAFDCARKLGRIGLAPSVKDLAKEQGLGPDALEVAGDVERLRELLGHKRGGVKSALMDQNLLAGIGNIYSDEILFVAGVHPATRVPDLTAEQTRKMAKAMEEVLRGAIDLRVGEEGWPGRWLVPLRRQGKTCPRCGDKIQRETIAGRSSYFCKGHQHC